MSEDGEESLAALHKAAWVHIDAERFEEAEIALRKLIERIDPDDAERRWNYFGLMANQCLIFGHPSDALAEATPVPSGTGHVQCLLHAVAAEALWKLERPEEARTAAQGAIAACPTDDRRAQLSEQLGYILGRT